MSGERIHSAGVCRSMRTQSEERRQAASAAPRVLGNRGGRWRRLVWGVLCKGEVGARGVRVEFSLGREKSEGGGKGWGGRFGEGYEFLCRMRAFLSLLFVCLFLVEGLEVGEEEENCTGVL